MDATYLSRVTRTFGPGSRRAALTLAAGSMAALFNPAGRDGAARKNKNKRKKKRKKNGSPTTPCSGKNWCVDRSQTCGPEGGYGKCLVEAFGDNVCAEILFQAATCADCDPGSCVDCVCVLATGGGDRCNNGPAGNEFICARPL